MRSAIAFAIVKYAGVAYLLFMAWQTLKEHGALQVETKADPRSAWRVLRDGQRRHQPAQPQALDLLRRLPAAVHRGRAKSSRWRGCWSSPACSWR